MNKEFRRFSSIVVLLLSVITATAQDDKSEMFNPVNYSVTSQMIAPDARAAGLGDVGAATDPDVNSQFWNPAKYPFTISRAGVALNQRNKWAVEAKGRNALPQEVISAKELH